MLRALSRISGPTRVVQHRNALVSVHWRTFLRFRLPSSPRDDPQLGATFHPPRATSSADLPQSAPPFDIKVSDHAFQFDFTLAVALAGAAFEAYADVDTKSLVQLLPGGECEITYTDPNFLHTCMAGLLRVTLSDVRFVASAEDLANEKKANDEKEHGYTTRDDDDGRARKQAEQEKKGEETAEEGGEGEIRPEKPPAFQVAVSHDSWAPKLFADDTEQEFLFVRDPSRQWLSLKLEDDGYDSPATALLQLTDVADGHTLQKRLTLRSEGKEVGTVEATLKLFPFTDVLAGEASKSEMCCGREVLARPGPALMSADWQKLRGTVVSASEAAFDPVAFIEAAKTDTQVWIFWAPHARVLVVAFRGTEQDRWRDVLTDISMSPLPLNTGKLGELPRTLPLAELSSEPGTLENVLNKVERAKREVAAVKKHTSASDKRDDGKGDDGGSHGGNIDKEKAKDNDEDEDEHGAISAAVGAVLSTAEELQQLLGRVKMLVEEGETVAPMHQHDCWVHSGFLNAYDSVRPAVLGLIECVLAAEHAATARSNGAEKRDGHGQEQQQVDGSGGGGGEGNDKESKRGEETRAPWTIVFTGHSLGGALATLAALDVSRREWLETYKPRLKMYNFGSPRVGNGEFAADFNRHVPDAWRVVNADDAVATIPRLMGYHHVGHMVSVQQGGKVQVQHSSETPFEGASMDQIMPAVSAAITAAVSAKMPSMFDSVASAVPPVLEKIGREVSSTLSTSQDDGDSGDEHAKRDNDKKSGLLSSIEAMEEDREGPHSESAVANKEPVDVSKEEERKDDEVSGKSLTPEQLDALWEQEKEAWSMLLRGKAISEHMEEQYFEALQGAAEAWRRAAASEEGNKGAPATSGEA